MTLDARDGLITLTVRDRGRGLGRVTSTREAASAACASGRR